MARPTQISSPEEDQHALLDHTIELASVTRIRDGEEGKISSGNDPDLAQAISNKRPGMILRLYHQADFIVLLAALVAISFGAIVAADARNTSHNLKEEQQRRREHQYEPDFRPTFLRDNIATALILFGAVTALAWNVMGYASFRAVSSDATKYLVRGIRQKDFSKIFEIGLPDKLWLCWRLRLWKSTVFILFQGACYIGIGLSYRLAFRTDEATGTMSLSDTYTDFLMGCDPYQVAPKFANLLEQQYFTFDWTLSINPYVVWDARAAAWVDDASWQPVVGWHSSFFEVQLQEQRGFQKTAGWSATFTGPFLTGALQKKVSASEKALNGERGWVQTISEHAECGWLPLICRYDPGQTNLSGVVPECFWAGLIVDIMTAIKTQPPWKTRWNISEAKFLQDGGSQPFSSGACPLQMTKQFYETFSNTSDPYDTGNIAARLRNVTSMTGLDLDITMPKWTEYFAWMIAKAQAAILEDTYPNQNGMRKNSTALTRLVEQRLWPPVGDDQEVICSLATTEKPNYTGSATFVYTTTEWVSHQTTAAILLILWGLSLLALAYPFNSIVVKGNLNQYMSFGADIGQLSMRGASSGHSPAEDGSIWCLRLEIDSSGLRRFYFTREEYGGEALGEEAVVEARINKRYI